MTDDPKVVRIDGRPVDQSFDVEDYIVENLEFFLEEARAGRVKSLGLVVVNDDQGMQSFYHTGRGQSFVPLVGAITRLQYHINQHLDGQERDIP